MPRPTTVEDGSLIAQSSGARQFKMLRVAVMKGWEVTDDIRSDVIRGAHECLSNPDAKERDRAAARKLLLEIDKFRFEAGKAEDLSNKRAGIEIHVTNNKLSMDNLPPEALESFLSALAAIPDTTVPDSAQEPIDIEANVSTPDPSQGTQD